jgi:transcription antitermination factor NusG
VNRLSNQKKYWYALRITYSRELALKAFLDQNHIENFVPMRYEFAFRNGHRIRKLVPAVHNLVFIRATRKAIDEIKEENVISLPMRYIMDRETRQPIIIPESQMCHFIAVAGNYEQQVIYLPPVEYSMQKGDRVRITGGVFEGVEGVFVRVKGDRRVVVSIQGVMAVATAFIHPSLIERIETQIDTVSTPSVFNS